MEVWYGRKHQHNRQPGWDWVIEISRGKDGLSFPNPNVLLPQLIHINKDKTYLI